MREDAHSLDLFASSQPWTLPVCPSGYQAQLAAAAVSFPQAFLKQEAAQCWMCCLSFPDCQRKGKSPTCHCLHVRQGRKWLYSAFFFKLYRAEFLKISLYFISHSFECFLFTFLASFQPWALCYLSDMSNGSSLWRDAKPFCLTCFEISSCYLKTSSRKDLDITWLKEGKKMVLQRKTGRVAMHSRNTMLWFMLLWGCLY